MKIVGSINGSNFLAELTYQEIKYLAGKEIGYEANHQSYGQRTIPSGVTFEITKAFEQIHRNDQRKKEIDTVRKTLEGVINSLDIIDPFIEEPKVEEPAGEA
jgi:hypothetical protein